MIPISPEPVIPRTPPDFSNTELAFAHLSDRDLQKAAWLFTLMNKAWLVKSGSAFTLWLNKAGIRLFDPIVRATIFDHFCGGTTLADSAKTIDRLWRQQVFTVLDFGLEGKSGDDNFDKTLAENLRAIRFASATSGIPVISSKVTGLADERLLEKIQAGDTLSPDEQAAFARVENRLETLCQAAADAGLSVYIDAEETWIQDTIDKLVKTLMARHNRQRVVVFHTYQLYRTDKLAGLKADHEEAKAKGYLLGVKTVRGAYMEKERLRAIEREYPSPIQPDKASTDRDYDAAIRYCIAHHEEIALCNSTHNAESNLLQARLMDDLGLPRDHPHLAFCQLYGMSDNLTFNLARAGFKAGKYVPYGPVHEVMRYLIRRAQENTSVTGEMSRERKFLLAEMKRRGMK